MIQQICGNRINMDGWIYLSFHYLGFQLMKLNYHIRLTQKFGVMKSMFNTSFNVLKGSFKLTNEPSLNSNSTLLNLTADVAL